VAAKGSLDLSSQRPEGLDKIKALESRGKATREEELTTFLKPVFTTALLNVVMSENQSTHLASRLVLVGDASLKVEWYKEGKLLETGGIIINLCCFPKFFLLVLICPNVKRLGEGQQSKYPRVFSISMGAHKSQPAYTAMFFMHSTILSASFAIMSSMVLCLPQFFFSLSLSLSLSPSPTHFTVIFKWLRHVCLVCQTPT
jgi:hypothetical protein